MDYYKKGSIKMTGCNLVLNVSGKLYSNRIIILRFMFIISDWRKFFLDGWTLKTGFWKMDTDKGRGELTKKK